MAKKKKYQAALNSKIRSALRRIWRYGAKDYKARAQALAAQKVGASTWECEVCKTHTKKPNVDHTNAVVDPKKGFEGWDVYIQRMFVESAFLTVMCKDCHKKESTEENLIRKKYKTGIYKKRKKKT